MFLGSYIQRMANIREEKLIEGVLRGKPPARAARDAGYSKSFAHVDVYRTLAKPSILKRIQERRDEAHVETKEIIGTLTSQMRGDLADLFPDDEFLKKARDRGVSHLIRRYRRRERLIPNGRAKPIREVLTEVELHDSQSAAVQLCRVFGLHDLPKPKSSDPQRDLETALDRFVERATSCGMGDTPNLREEGRRLLAPLFGIPL